MPKHLNKIFYGFYILLFIQLVSSIFQFIFPKENSKFADPSGLLILQDFYLTTTLLCLFLTTFFGLYLLARTFRAKKTFSFYLSPLFLTLALPFFLLVFLELASFLRNNFDYIDHVDKPNDGFILLHQDAVILSLLLFLSQFLAAFFWQKNFYKKDQENVGN